MKLARYAVVGEAIDVAQGMLTALRARPPRPVHGVKDTTDGTDGSATDVSAEHADGARNGPIATVDERQSS
jgi:hypothetical protein